MPARAPVGGLRFLHRRRRERGWGRSAPLDAARLQFRWILRALIDALAPVVARVDLDGVKDERDLGRRIAEALRGR